MPMSDSQLEILFRCLDSIEDESFWEDVSCQSELLTESFVEYFCHKLNMKSVLKSRELSKDFIVELTDECDLEEDVIVELDNTNLILSPATLRFKEPP